MEIAESLALPKAVARSKQLPFRFWSAARAISALPIKGKNRLKDKALQAVHEALEASVWNSPTWPRP